MLSSDLYSFTDICDDNVFIHLNPKTNPPAHVNVSQHAVHQHSRHVARVCGVRYLALPSQADPARLVECCQCLFAIHSAFYCPISTYVSRVSIICLLVAARESLSSSVGRPIVHSLESVARPPSVRNTWGLFKPVLGDFYVRFVP